MPRASVAERHPRDPPEDEPERLWHGTTGEDKQRVADHDRRGERHAAAGFRIGPSDRGDVQGDVAHVRPRGVDGLRDDAFAIDPANRRGGDRLGADGNGGLPLRLAVTRGPRWHAGAKRYSLITRHEPHAVSWPARAAPARRDRPGAEDTGARSLPMAGAMRRAQLDCAYGDSVAKAPGPRPLSIRGADHSPGAAQRSTRARYSWRRHRPQTRRRTNR